MTQIGVTFCYSIVYKKIRQIVDIKSLRAILRL